MQYWPVITDLRALQSLRGSGLLHKIDDRSVLPSSPTFHVEVRSLHPELAVALPLQSVNQ